MGCYGGYNKSGGGVTVGITGLSGVLSYSTLFFMWQIRSLNFRALIHFKIFYFILPNLFTKIIIKSGVNWVKNNMFLNPMN